GQGADPPTDRRGLPGARRRGAGAGLRGRGADPGPRAHRERRLMRSPLEALQSLGRALMLPIAVLPAAGLLLRLGQPDLLNLPLLAAAGDAIFSNLGLLFAAGVAVGLARDNHGAAGLAGVVAFLIATNGAQTLLHVPPDALKGMAGDAADLAKSAFKSKATGKLGVPIGIVCGLIGGAFYNRFSNLKLPDYLAFF